METNREVSDISRYSASAILIAILAVGAIAFVAWLTN